MENKAISNVLNLFLATLRAIYLLHQFNHWTCKHNNFYGLHLLFERIYKSAQENADLAAEKFIGVFGPDTLDYEKQAELIAKILKLYKNMEDDPVKMSMTAEADFLKLSQKCYDILKNKSVMTMGLDDAIMSISSDREEAMYLLQQTAE